MCGRERPKWGICLMTKEQWVALKTCDKSFDGKFYYGLKTTKKVCRPSCPKRSYDPKRTVIFDTLRQALDMGYQPCSRCHPELEDWTDGKTDLAKRTEDYIRRHYAEKLSLSEIGKGMHLNKSYLARVFRKATGRTLMDYVYLVRCEAAREQLTHPELPVSLIASSVGFATASHFSQVFRRVVGCTPSEYREAFFKSLEE